MKIKSGKYLGLRVPFFYLFAGKAKCQLNRKTQKVENKN